MTSFLGFFLLVSSVRAGGIDILPSASVLGTEDFGIRPGIRLGYEPTPSLGVDLCGSFGVGENGFFDGGAGFEGRHWFGDDPGQGVFVGGRLDAGIAGAPEAVGPWVGLAAAFGVRPIPWLHFEANVGPDMAFVDGRDAALSLRSDLVIGVVLDTSLFKGDRDTVRHHPRKL